jgi:predicted PolB exonuclease-like 3'-5' exonuclease
MKKNLMTSLLILGSSLFSLTSYSQTENSSLSAGGAGTKGGGEIAEADFKSRRDNLLNDFYLKGGAEKLDLLKYNVTAKDYADAMIQSMREGATKVHFVTEEENKKLSSERNVSIGDVSKTCAWNKLNPKLPEIVCIIERYWQTPKDLRIQLINHEYDLGRFEKPNNSDSDYGISKQLADFTTQFIDYKVSIDKNNQNSLLNNFRSKFETAKTLDIDKLKFDVNLIKDLNCLQLAKHGEGFKYNASHSVRLNKFGDYIQINYRGVWFILKANTEEYFVNQHDFEQYKSQESIPAYLALRMKDKYIAIEFSAPIPEESFSLQPLSSAPTNYKVLHYQYCIF